MCHTTSTATRTLAPHSAQYVSRTNFLAYNVTELKTCNLCEVPTSNYETVPDTNYQLHKLERGTTSTPGRRALSFFSRNEHENAGIIAQAQFVGSVGLQGDPCAVDRVGAVYDKRAPAVVRGDVLERGPTNAVFQGGKEGGVGSREPCCRITEGS